MNIFLQSFFLEHFVFADICRMRKSEVLAKMEGIKGHLQLTNIDISRVRMEERGVETFDTSQIEGKWD